MILKKLTALIVIAFSCVLTGFSSPLKPYINDDAVFSVIYLEKGNTLSTTFGKTYLRIYDKKDNFDELFDFSHMESLDGFRFVYNMAFKRNLACITHTRFLPFILNERKNLNRAWSEKVLDLDNHQKTILYSNLINMINTHPDGYEYDFLIRNGTSTLNDLLRNSCGVTLNQKKKFNVYSYFQYVFEDRPVSLCVSYFLTGFKADNHLPSGIKSINADYMKISSVNYNSPREHIVLLIFTFAVITFTLIQVFYRNKSNLLFQLDKSVRVFDMLLMFMAGIAGCFIVYFDIFSKQFILTNNFNFMWLFPLNVFASVFMLSDRAMKRLRSYWTLAAVLILWSFFAYEIIPGCFVLSNFLLKLIIFTRCLYITVPLWINR